MISTFDNMISDMMQMYGSYAYIDVAVKEYWDEDKSENIVERKDYKVKACFFDYLDKKAGVSTEGTTLVQTGDKQVLIQPPHKTATSVPLPHIQPNRDRLKIGDKVYKIVALKEYNPSMARAGCVLYEAYVRE